MNKYTLTTLLNDGSEVQMTVTGQDIRKAQVAFELAVDVLDGQTTYPKRIGLAGVVLGWLGLN